MLPMSVMGQVINHELGLGPAPFPKCKENDVTEAHQICERYLSMQEKLTFTTQIGRSKRAFSALESALKENAHEDSCKALNDQVQDLTQSLNDLQAINISANSQSDIAQKLLNDRIRQLNELKMSIASLRRTIKSEPDKLEQFINEFSSRSTIYVTSIP